MSLHAKNFLILALALGGAVPFGWRAVASLSLGGGIQIVNLRGLERSVTGMLQQAAEGRGGVLQALLTLRLLLLLGLVGLVLLKLPVQPIAFAVGLSTVVPALIWHGLAPGQREA